jgi:hypothetical protein
MDLVVSLSRLGRRFDEAGIRYALIGGLAMALRGVQRATFDLDFLLMLSDLDAADSILNAEGCTRVYKSENVSHYQHPAPGGLRVDILHAFRGPSLGMLGRADRLELTPGCSLPVLRIEDIVGLKIQALVNNPARALGDWNDIHRLIRHAGEQAAPLEWELIADYLEIFNLSDRLLGLRGVYDEAH